MQSKTSCFNRTVFTKTLRRFWPVWTGYALLWFLIIPLTVIRGGMEGVSELNMCSTLLSLSDTVSPLVIFAASILTAMAAFGWMYQSRSVSFTTALPITRSGMFLSSALSGAAVLLGVNVLTALVGWLCAMGAGYDAGGVMLTFLAVSTMDVLCFYGFALLCAQLTGSLIILPLVYAVLQLTAAVVESLLNYLGQNLIYGYIRGSSVLQFFSPIYGRLNHTHVSPVFSTWEDAKREVIGYELQGWGVMIAYAVFGVVCLLLAWWLYRRRRMESAGDTVAVGVLKPIFRWCMAVGSAMVFAACVYYLLYQGRYVPGDMTHALILMALMVVGGLLGWFVADMLIYKFFNVFAYHWKGAMLLTALLVMCTLATELDVLGVEKRIPDGEECGMAWVIVNGDQCKLYEPENIRALTEIHRAIVEDKARHESKSARESRVVQIMYFHDGTYEDFLARTYRIAYDEEEFNDPDSAIRSLERLMNQEECILRRKELRVPVREDTVTYAHVEPYRNYGNTNLGESYFGDLPERQGNVLLLSREDMAELYNACILPDIGDGTLGRIWLVEDETYAKTVLNVEINMHLGLMEEGGMLQDADYFYTVPTVDSVRTNAWLEEHGVKLETLWEHMEQFDVTQELANISTRVPAAAAEKVEYYYGPTKK